MRQSSHDSNSENNRIERDPDQKWSGFFDAFDFFQAFRILRTISIIVLSHAIPNRPFGRIADAFLKHCLLDFRSK